MLEREVKIDLTPYEAIGAWKCLKIIAEGRTRPKNATLLKYFLEEIFSLTEKDMMILLSCMSKLAEKIDAEQKSNRDKVEASQGVLPNVEVRPIQ